MKENKGNGSEIAVLMTLLLFDEIASSEMWLVFPQHLSKSIYFLLLSAFITDISDFFIIDRLEKANTDVKISPFSLPLTAARR